jgi:hypothetical protein
MSYTRLDDASAAPHFRNTSIVQIPAQLTRNQPVGYKNQTVKHTSLAVSRMSMKP